MSTPSPADTSRPSPNRLSRTSAKEVPHRKDDRLYAARAGIKVRCEQMLIDLRTARLSGPVTEEWERAVAQVLAQAKDLTPVVPKATSAAKDLAKDVAHLVVAQQWVSAAGRVLSRLGADGAHGLRAGVEKATEDVMSCVRSGAWDGQLTAAVDTLKRRVSDAETSAARGPVEEPDEPEAETAS